MLLFLLDFLKWKITPAPTSRKVKEKILELLPFEVQGEIFELGSGFGKMATTLCDAYPSLRVNSFEKAILPYGLQRIVISYRKLKNIKLLDEDFTKQDLSSAGLVFCYLYKSIMPILSEKFKRELRAGTWVISHTFALPGWKPTKMVYASDLYNTPIYVYRV